MMASGAWWLQEVRLASVWVSFPRDISPAVTLIYRIDCWWFSPQWWFSQLFKDETLSITGYLSLFLASCKINVPPSCDPFL